MNVYGSEQVQLTDTKKGSALNPRWSPDGTRLIFQSSKKDKKDFDLYVIDVDGNNLTQLTIKKSYDGQPYWTTDGYIYFVSDRGNEAGNYQIFYFLPRAFWLVDWVASVLRYALKSTQL